MKVKCDFCGYKTESNKEIPCPVCTEYKGKRVTIMRVDFEPVDVVLTEAITKLNGLLESMKG